MEVAFWPAFEGKILEKTRWGLVAPWGKMIGFFKEYLCVFSGSYIYIHMMCVLYRSIAHKPRKFQNSRKKKSLQRYLGKMKELSSEPKAWLFAEYRG